MYKRKGKFIKILLAISMALLVTLTYGCDTTETVNPGDNLIYSVIYDGNGGYLGNKTNTSRKLQVAADSKIPKYLSEYTEDPYVVSSLGLATRVGYLLKGWYLEENATYEENATGAYVYLDEADGNGMYLLDELGDYVLGYVEALDGELIYIDVEEIPEGTEPETVEYIYYQGTNGWAFYIYNAEDPDMVTVYEADGSYTPAQLTAYGSAYLVFEELTTAQQELFVDIPRYNRDFYLYTEADEGLDRYSFGNGYAFLDTMMEEDTLGEFVFFNGEYVVFDEGNAEHEDLDRYSINVKFVFTPTAGVESPSDLVRYNATILYWDFEANRVNSDLTLKAHWVKKCTVQYIQKSGQITTITTKMNPENTAAIDLVAGETIGKLETIPAYAGYTFVGWSTSETEYLPWDFLTDVFPDDTDTLNLYAFMIQGTYIRITGASGLARVVEDPDAKYVLCADIDLAGAVFTNATPTGFVLRASIGASHVPFTGTFLSMGYTISNFTLKVRNAQKLINQDAGVVAISGLFLFVEGATIDGVTLDNVTVLLETSTTAANVICDLGAGALIGTVLEGEENTIITNCSVDVTFTATSANVLNCPVYVGDIVALGAEFATITGCTSNIDYSAILGITTDTLIVETLD